MDKNIKELHKKIYSLLRREEDHEEKSYSSMLGKPYQTYDRINFQGSRWSVEKRIKEYGLERFYNSDSKILDIGSNYGFFVAEFALHCKEVHGIEPTQELNMIGQAVADYLGVGNKVVFHCLPFEEFSEKTKFDTVLSLASFYTADGRERSGAEKYFGKIHRLLQENGDCFFESTAYHKNPEEPNYSHYVNTMKAVEMMKSIFVEIEEWETPTGHDGNAFRYFFVGKKA